MNDAPHATPPRFPAWARVAAAAVLVAGLAILARRAPAGAALDWIRAQGPWAPVLFVLLYVAACVAFVPGSILTLGAGAAFGPVAGFAWVSLASTLGATASFLVGRFAARDLLARRLARDPRFAAIDAAVAREGWKIVGLLRLSPVVPFNLLNYALGLTRIRLRDYVAASWIGMMPGTALVVGVGAALGDAARRGEGAARRTPAEWAYLAAGLGATIAASWFVARLARRALARRIP